MPILSLPVSFGEAADKVAILEIKRERIADPVKRLNIETEFEMISAPFFEAARQRPGFEPLFAKLKDVNLRLWDIEENIRQHERRGDFGAGFVRLARAVYQTNDERVRVKRALDRLFDSRIVEEKSYVEHGPGEA